ncbi:MAG: hypothetical protein JWM90_1087 [Thermoleophilia bacterium]|nr:hypothetical protein [Thermoleophilia bacterium]
MDADDATPTGPDHADRVADLDALANENRDATWGETRGGSAWVPGIISGDLGVKGKISAQLREQSRRERQERRSVMPGATTPGSARIVLLPMLAIAAGLVAVIALIVWLVA